MPRIVNGNFTTERLDNLVRRAVEGLMTRADPNHKFENERASAYAARLNLTQTSDYLKRQETVEVDESVTNLHGRFNQTDSHHTAG